MHVCMSKQYLEVELMHNFRSISNHRYDMDNKTQHDLFITTLMGLNTLGIPEFEGL